MHGLFGGPLSLGALGPGPAGPLDKMALERSTFCTDLMAWRHYNCVTSYVCTVRLRMHIRTVLLSKSVCLSVCPSFKRVHC